MCPTFLDDPVYCEVWLPTILQGILFFVHFIELVSTWIINDFFARNVFLQSVNKGIVITLTKHTSLSYDKAVTQLAQAISVLQQSRKI